MQFARTDREANVAAPRPREVVTRRDANTFRMFPPRLNGYLSMNRLRAAVVVVPLLFAIEAGAQKPQMPALSESIDVSIVNLDVIVTDRHGHRVRGLKASDFEVRQDGKVQTLTNFSETVAEPPAGLASSEQTAVTPASTNADAGKPQSARRLVTIFIERARLQPWDADRLFDSIEKTVQRVVRPGDTAVVAFWDRGMEIKQDFTDDAASLTRALRELRDLEKKVMLPDARSIQSRQQEQNDAAYEAAQMTAATGIDFPVPDTMSMDSLMLARRALAQIRGKVNALRAFIGIMAPAEGRKVLIVATRRLSRYAGAEFFTNAHVPPELRQELDTSYLLDSLAAAANAAGVTVYAFNPTGLESQVTISAENASAPTENTAFDANVLMNEAGPLDELARATGGVAAWSAKDVADRIPVVGEDLETYYSLAYRTPPGARKDHHVVVRTVNPAYKARSRTSFVEKNEGEQMAGRVLAQLFRPVEENALAISAEAGAPKKEGRHLALPVKIRIPIGRLTLLPAGLTSSGSFTVFAVAGGKVGVAGDVTRKTQTFSIPRADLDKARRSHYTFDFTVVTDGVAENLAVGVLDDVSKEFGITRVSIRQSTITRPSR